MVKLFVPILVIGLCFCSDLYIFLRYIKPAALSSHSSFFTRHSSFFKWLWWLPLVVVLALFAKFLFFNAGLEKEYTATNIFLLVMVLVCVPKILFSLFSLIPKVGTYVGLAVALLIVYIVVYGITIGFNQLKVKHITYESTSVPEAFDGYKIVQFSDGHVGSFRGPYAHLLKETMDSINAQKPDLICFVGDIQNFTPNELEAHRKAFSSLKAPDGVMTIMGNHDYSTYLKLPAKEEAAMVQRTRNTQRSFGWDLLEDEHRIIHRGNDSIYIIGEENWGLPPFPQFGDIKKAVGDIAKTLDKNKQTPTLSIMLSHDPNAWRHHIMPVIKPDITLAGHTHGTQFGLFGWSPSSMVYDEWGGEYYYNGNGLREAPEHQLERKNDNGNGVSRMTTEERPTLLSVSTGFGGNFPFRFGMPREIVVITLKKK
jgi:predicted MPP superfamily phosphohydrolase